MPQALKNREHFLSTVAQHTNIITWQGYSSSDFYGIIVKYQNRPAAASILSSQLLWKDLICNDLCQPPKVDNQAKTNYSVAGKHPDRVMISDPGIGHSDIRGFGLLLTYRSMVRRERHRLPMWITVSCANSDLFVDRSNLDKTITLSRCFP